MLAPKHYRHPKAVLARTQCWHERSVGTKAVLARTQCWHKSSVGTKAVLAPKNHVYTHVYFTGDSEIVLKQKLVDRMAYYLRCQPFALDIDYENVVHQEL